MSTSLVASMVQMYSMLVMQIFCCHYGDSIDLVCWAINLPILSEQQMYWSLGGSHYLVATTMVADATGHDCQNDSLYPMHDASNVVFHAMHLTVVQVGQSMDDGCQHHYRQYCSSTHLLASRHWNVTSWYAQKPTAMTMSPHDCRSHDLALNWHCLATLTHVSCWSVHLTPSMPTNRPHSAPRTQVYDMDGSAVAVVATLNGNCQYANEMAYCGPYCR